MFCFEPLVAQFEHSVYACMFQKKRFLLEILLHMVIGNTKNRMGGFCLEGCITDRRITRLEKTGWG